MATNEFYGQDPDSQGVPMDGAFNSQPYNGLDDLNPDELATFPKQVTGTGHSHHESHLVSHRTPVRDGRNIVRTDNQPNRGGYL